MGAPPQGSVSVLQTLKNQPVIWIDETATQNIWETVIDTTEPGMLLEAGMAMQTLAEDLEMRITIDNQVYTGAQTAVAGSGYHGLTLAVGATGNGTIVFETNATTDVLHEKYQALKVEVRKTTANGANKLNGWVQYAKYE